MSISIIVCFLFFFSGIVNISGSVNISLDNNLEIILYKNYFKDFFSLVVWIQSEFAINTWNSNKSFFKVEHDFVSFLSKNGICYCVIGYF